MKIKNGSRYVYQCSHISTTSDGNSALSDPDVVAMCICQAIFEAGCSRYVYTFIIYQGYLSTDDQREEARDVETSSHAWRFEA